MGLTTSLFTSLTGLNSNSQLLSVSGNNIANVNTLGFKGSRVTFETSILQNLGPATAPNGSNGGTNPTQVGLGSRIGAITRSFTNGSLEPTGIPSDIAIEGAGFFTVQLGEEQLYTRAGSFKLDRDYNLVTNDGAKLMGFDIDNEFELVEGILQPLQVPLGILTVAEATTEVVMSGNLNSSGDPATQGSVSVTESLFDGGALATGATLLTNVSNVAAGPTQFATGDIITISNITKGGAVMPEVTFEVGPAVTGDATGAGETLQDFADFLNEVIGIDEGPGAHATGLPGITINAAGQLQVVGNSGSVNDIKFDPSTFITNKGIAPAIPFTVDESDPLTREADGESVRTTIVAYDSLGVEMEIDLNVVLESKDNGGTNWRFYAQSNDDSDLDRVLGNGTLQFDTNGRLLLVQNGDVIVDREGTGADGPQSISIGFESDAGRLSALGSVTSQLQQLNQNGSPIGTLEDYTVGEDGLITGIFSNSLLRNLGQVVLANFSNPQGLIEVGSSLFNVTPNSGTPQILIPGTGGTGRTVGGALELSNIELAQEFVNLISASTGFSANSRVLTTSDQLIQELLSAVR